MLNQSGLEQAHYLYQVDLMLSAEGLHQLDVHGLVAVGCKGAEMGLTPAKQPCINSEQGFYTIYAFRSLTTYLRQKLGNNGRLPHKSSVEGAKTSSAIHPRTNQHIDEVQ